MITGLLLNEQAGSFSRRQQVFIRYTYLVLIDLTALNLIDEFWSYLHIASFSISLLVALLLQVLLQATVAVEHRVAEFFKKKTGVKAKIFRGVSTWGILFLSKLIMLGALDMAFGSDILFSGPIHGLLAFIIVIIGIIVAEQIFFRIYRSLS